jgi:hypothetical protein
VIAMLDRFARQLGVGTDIFDASAKEKHHA